MCLVPSRDEMRGVLAKACESGLRGPVRSILAESLRGSASRDWLSTSTFLYAEDGSLLEESHRHQGGTHWLAIHLYDEDCRLRESRYEGKGIHSNDRLRLYFYDSCGRLEKVLARSADGEERVAESWHYEESGAKTHTLYPDPWIRNQQVTFSGEAYMHLSTDAAAVMTLFSPDGRMKRKILYDEFDRPVRRILYRYDEMGRLVEEGESDGYGGIRQDFRNVFYFDRAGRHSRIECVVPSFGGHKRIRGYNCNGDVSREQFAPIPGDGLEGLGADGLNGFSRYRYRYDQWGNWTERYIAGGSDGVKGTRRVSMFRLERRSIEYHAGAGNGMSAGASAGR